MCSFVDPVVVCSLVSGDKCFRRVVDFFLYLLVVDPESHLVHVGIQCS